MVYKQLTLRAKSAKQVLEFDHHAKSNNKETLRVNFAILQAKSPL